MDKSVVFYQGQFTKENQVYINIRNMAFNYGLGCFEGIRAYWNDEKKQLYIFRMYDHFSRLLRSCKTLHIDIPYTVDQLCQITIELLIRNKYATNVYIRPLAFKGATLEYPHLLDPDNRLVIYSFPMGELLGEKEGLSVAISSWTRVTNNMIPPMAKPTAGYLNSALASTEAIKNGFDEAIFLTKEGNVSEGPGENIFIVRNGTLITPPLKDDILEGITRNTVMRIARNELGLNVIERSIPRAELYSAEEAFFTGTAIELKPIIEIDRRKVGSGKVGVIFNEIKSYFANIVYGDNPKYRYFNTPVYYNSHSSQLNNLKFKR